MSVGDSLIGREVALALSQLDAVIDRMPGDFERHLAGRWPRYILLSGSEAARYTELRAACVAVQATALEHAAAQAKLRDAIQELGRVVAPAAKSE